MHGVLQITGVAQIPLAEAAFIVDPKSVVPVAVDLIRPERAGLGKFVGGGVGGVAKLGKGVGKAGLSGMPCSTPNSNKVGLIWGLP